MMNGDSIDSLYTPLLTGNHGEITHIRPTTPIEMLDRVFAIFTVRPWVFLALAALYALPSAAATTGLYLFYCSTSSPIDAIGYLPWFFASFFIEQWPCAAILLTVFQTYSSPQKPYGIITALGSAFKRLPYLILTRTLVWFILLLLFGVFVQSVLSPAAGGTFTGSLAQVIGLWCLAASIYFLMMWILVPPIVVIERASFFRAMVRSMQLMAMSFRPGLLKGDTARRRFLLLALFPAAVWLTAQGLLQSVSIARSGTIIFMTPHDPLLYFTAMGLDFIVNLTAGLWILIASPLLYIECRIRREALDVHMRLTNATISDK
ncbi:MAG: hypothetical protein NTY46_13000 [Candidatus Sumerlaeota bacterium]|nr:hypothetical protein [Candidatus Sumerlaeota bacterium]